MASKTNDTIVEKPSEGFIEDTENHQLGHLANQEDHELTKWQSLKRYPWTFTWCVYAVWCILLVSFENQASGNVTGIPEFRKDFGHFYEGSWVLDAKWQSAFSGGPVASAVVGALCSGQIADAVGRKMTIFGALLISVAAVTLEFRATTNEMFFGGKFLNGFAVGALASVPITYIGEVSLILRKLISLIQLHVKVYLCILIDCATRSSWCSYLSDSSRIRYWTTGGSSNNQLDGGIHQPLGLPRRLRRTIRLRGYCTCVHPLHARISMVAHLERSRRQSPEITS